MSNALVIVGSIYFSKKLNDELTSNKRWKKIWALFTQKLIAELNVFLMISAET